MGGSFLMELNTGYNLSAVFVALFNKFYDTQGQKQQNSGKEVEVWKRFLALMTELKGHVTDALSKGEKVISLFPHRNLVDRVKLVAKELGRTDILSLVNTAYALESPQAAESLTTRFDEEATAAGQEINLRLTNMTRQEKETGETHKIVSDMLKQESEFGKSILKKI
jgi:hypothetical protein